MKNDNDKKQYDENLWAAFAIPTQVVLYIVGGAALGLLVGHFIDGKLDSTPVATFIGLLFGLGLYARYQSDPDGFKAGYDDLLSSTGMSDAAELAEHFGIDIRSVDFWRASFDVLRGDIDRFEELVAAT